MPTTSQQVIQIAERRQKVFELKLIGMTNRAIQSHLATEGITISHVTVGKDWHKVLSDAAEARSTEINILKELQVARYEVLIEAHWANATGHKLSQPGVKGDPDPRSAEIILRTIKGIRELYGLDSAVGTVENPLTLNLPPIEEPDVDLDLSEMTQDDLERLSDILGALIEAQEITTRDA